MVLNFSNLAIFEGFELKIFETENMVLLFSVDVEDIPYFNTPTNIDSDHFEHKGNKCVYNYNTNAWGPWGANHSKSTNHYNDHQWPSKSEIAFQDNWQCNIGIVLSLFMNAATLVDNVDN